MHTFICICLCVYAEANRNVRWVRMMHWNRSKVEKEQKDTHRKHEQKRKKPGRRIRHPCNEKTHCEQQKCYRSSNSLTHIIQCILGFSLYFEPTTQQQQALKTSSSLPYYKFSMYCEYVAVLSSAQKTIQYIAFFFFHFPCLRLDENRCESRVKPFSGLFCGNFDRCRYMSESSEVSRLCVCVCVYFGFIEILSDRLHFFEQATESRTPDMLMLYCICQRNKTKIIAYMRNILYCTYMCTTLLLLLLLFSWIERR